MEIEVLGIYIDSIVALTAIAGVLVAAYLGRKAVGVAVETVDRSARDYAAGRVDVLAEWHGALVQTMAELKADMHVYWKEDPEVLLAADPQSTRAHELMAKRAEAEVAVHRSMYRLSGTAVRLEKVVPAVRVELSDGILPTANDVSRALASIQLFRLSAMPLYLSLVASSNQFPDPSSEAIRFKAEFLFQLHPEPADGAMKSMLADASKWLDNYLEENKEAPLSPAIVAIGFIEGFTQEQLDSAIEQLGNPILEICRPAVRGSISVPPAG